MILQRRGWGGGSSNVRTSLIGLCLGPAVLSRTARTAHSVVPTVATLCSCDDRTTRSAASRRPPNAPSCSI